jgi:hypothetical protein
VDSSPRLLLSVFSSILLFFFFSVLPEHRERDERVRSKIEREIRERVESREMRPRERVERLRVRTGELREMEPDPPMGDVDETRERRRRDLW